MTNEELFAGPLIAVFSSIVFIGCAGVGLSWVTSWSEEATGAVLAAIAWGLSGVIGFGNAQS